MVYTTCFFMSSHLFYTQFTFWLLSVSARVRVTYSFRFRIKQNSLFYCSKIIRIQFFFSSGIQMT